MLRGLFHYMRTRQPTPGTGALAFTRPQTDPVTVIQGRGMLTGGAILPLQPPQAYYVHVVPNAGIPTIAGQIFGQPLLNPDQ